MGLCLSKKELHKEKISSSTTSVPSIPTSDPPLQLKEKASVQLKEEKPTAVGAKKQTPVASWNKELDTKKEEKADVPKRVETAPKDEFCNAVTAAVVRTSSCTKEQVDAILIQCGRLSRSSSGKGSSESNGRGLNSGGSRKYAGCKRSYDFDHESGEMCDEEEREKPQIRPVHRRTPSREKDSGAAELKRSGSTDEGRRSGSRRASRSPGRRQETPTEKTRPGKMVSVPATVSGAGVRKISTVGAGKRSGEAGARGNASPRARSPANLRPCNENTLHHSQPSLSRSSSRKAEQSPYRRNPMSEIDDNIPKSEPTAMKNLDYNKSNKSNNSYNHNNSNKLARSKEAEGADKEAQLHLQKAAARYERNERNKKAVENPKGTGSNRSKGIREQLLSCRAMDQQLEHQITEEGADTKGSNKDSENAPASHAATENLIPQSIARSRSSRRSRDFDIAVGPNAETHSPHASLFLEDIQNYHNQSTPFSLPPCVSKAHSILEAVADLNSSTSSNISRVFSGDNCVEPDQPSHYNNETTANNNINQISINVRLNRKLKGKEPLVESEAVEKDYDLTEPSLHKYVTVRESGREQQESAGSNSFIGNPLAAASWEPNSVDSTDRWTSLSNTGEEVEQQSLTETTPEYEANVRRFRLGAGSSTTTFPAPTLNCKKREFDGKMGARSFSLPTVATAAADAVGQ